MLLMTAYEAYAQWTQKHPVWTVMGKKKKEKKTYLLVYSNNATDIIVERLTKKEISARIRYLELDDDEFTIIDGEIIEKP